MGTKIHFLIILLRKFIINNQRRIRNTFGVLLTLFTIISFVPLFFDKWRESCWDFFVRVYHQLPEFFSYFNDSRAFILYTLIFFLWVSLVYFRHEVRFLQMALDNKRELAMELPRIKNGCPNNHYLGLIIGELGEKALKVKEEKSTNIIASIDKNIKKYERVYWISEDKIGIIFYEANGKHWRDEYGFLNVIKKKLGIELGEVDAPQFLNDIIFEMVAIDLKKDEQLYDIEGKAKTILMRTKIAMAEANKQAAANQQASNI